MTAAVWWNLATQDSATAAGFTGWTPGSGSSLSVMRFKDYNATNVAAKYDNVDDTTYPMVKPTSGTNYSWSKIFRIWVDASATNSFTNLSQLQWYISANPVVTGLTIKFVTASSGSGTPAATGATISGSNAPTTATAWVSAAANVAAAWTAGIWTSAAWLILQAEVVNTIVVTSATWTTFATYNEI